MRFYRLYHQYGSWTVEYRDYDGGDWMRYAGYDSFEEAVRTIEQLTARKVYIPINLEF